MHSSRSIKLTPRGVVPSVICALSLGTPVCHPPFLACHHRPFQSPRPWRTLETPPTPLPGRADGCPSGPPTDPHVRNSRMRFLRQSSSYPSILSSGGVVTRLASSESLSCLVPTGTLCPTSPSLQWVAWVSLPHLRRYY